MQERLDELWSWLHPGLESLKDKRRSEPDTTWQQHRADLLEELGLADATWHPVTNLLLTRLDELPDDDRDRVLDGDDLDRMAYEAVQEVVAEEAPEDAADGGYDEAAWHHFAAEHLPHWHGTEESWPQFVDWFTYQADTADLTTPARGFIDHARPMSVEERIALFAQYGVAVPAAGETPTPDGTPGAGPDTAAGQATTAPTDDIVPDEAARAALADVLAENPHLADLPEDVRMEVLAEVLREQAAAGA